MDNFRFRTCRMLLTGLALLASGWDGAALAQGRPLSLVPQAPTTAVIGRPYTQQLIATGGTEGYTWRVPADTLPPGLQLDSKSGLLSGAATAAGSFAFDVTVTDSAAPAATDTKRFIIDVPSALTLDWKQAPRAGKEGITGSVVVSNQTGHAVDLTVIIVAVNEVGKAFALAEQHFPLQAEADSPTISFGTNFVLPFGKYTLHADAVGEVASENQIYRTRKQTSDDFVIKQQ
jgi:hypothetical protein